MPRAAAVALAAALAGGLSACAPEPYIDMRREAGTLTTWGSSTFDRPAICYNTMNATREQVQAMADAVCAETGRVAVYESSDLLHCTVLQPHRSLFRCAAAERTTVDAAGVRRLTPGVAGPQVPDARTAAQGPAAEAEAEDDLPIPQAPAAPTRPQSPAGEGLLGIF
ncbi:hypothetical protein [Caenispirillum bisanense]|uniref:hypothetical protein n=1 Tax=Caenispirillum bisanense TaxID=414052 RepID=UPI0031DF394A